MLYKLVHISQWPRDSESAFVFLRLVPAGLDRLRGLRDWSFDNGKVILLFLLQSSFLVL